MSCWDPTLPPRIWPHLTTWSIIVSCSINTVSSIPFQNEAKQSQSQKALDALGLKTTSSLTQLTFSEFPYPTMSSYPSSPLSLFPCPFQSFSFASLNKVQHINISLPQVQSLETLGSDCWREQAVFDVCVFSLQVWKAMHTFAEYCMWLNAFQALPKQSKTLSFKVLLFYIWKFQYICKEVDLTINLLSQTFLWELKCSNANSWDSIYSYTAQL